MKIIDLLSESSIELNARAGSKEDLIDRLVDLMDNSQVLVDKDLYKSDVLKREASSTTGIGEGVAIPSRVKGMINILMIFDLKIKLYYIIESLYYAISSDSIFSVKLASLLIIYE